MGCRKSSIQRRINWHDAEWPGLVRDPVLYELHIGTFTEAGTFAAAMRHLDDLAALGVTVVQIMPVAEFPGAFGWGYDGVGLFAPSRLYGRPDDMRRFVDRAHALGLAVILDVVYNHVGPDGNYLRAFARDYFSDRYENEWGEALNFDGPAVEAGARVGAEQRRLLDRGVPRRRFPARCHPADLRRLATSISSRRSPGRHGRRPVRSRCW